MKTQQEITERPGPRSGPDEKRSEMDATLNRMSRLMLLLATGALAVVPFVPVWRIELRAPQYPEGLSLLIYATGLRGNVDIINGLNHYIGMKTLHTKDFFEFTILPYLIGFFALASLVVTVINKRKWLLALFALFVAFGVVAIVDFWRWEYNYGHNLDPNAAIVVPGMAYQPPLIGYKQLLNFEAFSTPDTGGWLFLATGLLIAGAVAVTWNAKRRDSFKKSRFASVPGAVILALILYGCQQGPEPLVPGRDHCSFCKMGISDIKYGGELISSKGKIYKFDDLYCLVSFLKRNPTQTPFTVYVADFATPHTLIKGGESFFLQGGTVQGPMNGDVIGFKSKDSLQQAANHFQAKPVTWEQLLK